MGVLKSFKEKLHRFDDGRLMQELAWLWSRVKQHRGGIFAVGALALAGTVMGLGGSVASKYLIDAVTGRSVKALLWAGLLMAVMTLGSIGLRAVSSRVGARIHIRVKNEMQQRTFKRILRAGWEALEPYRSGDLLNRLNSDVGIVSDGIISFIPNLLTAALQFAGAFCIMLYYDPVMAVIALLGVPVTLTMSRFLLKKIRSQSQTMKELSGEVMSFQEDSFRNLTGIKAFSIGSRFADEMHRLLGTYTDAYLSFQAFQIRMSSVLSILAMLVSGACMAWGVYQLWMGRITYGSMTMFLQLASVMRSAFSGMVSLAQQTISLTTSAGRIQAVEELPKEDTRIPDGLEAENALAISLENVSFRYQTGEDVLRTSSFYAAAGDMVAITGPSGEGKTTLLRMMLGLVQPTEGVAVLKGKGCYPIGPGTRNVFAYVPQGNSIFSGTIAQNLRLIKEDATEEEMERALEIACALDFVKQLPGGLEYRLGAGGRGLSEGQAQRIAIARALLRRAPILLLDEATSALDMDTERRLMENLRTSGMINTCILVTHRLGSAQSCGRAYEIHQGVITEVAYEV